ncbi:MAG: mechanosensitive ion channel [Candidatus Amulumruptor caecigallinarius]|nr:mechanosensitive ion channel [Candidatus Amulumruptor caecigallinarius]MCM1397227.1 mechanosensitive ion channel [Candidatus Amulumruptor caecigallinarius]MCM1454776.1 mechanosensitive ion channel [bacterium]
MLPLQNLPLTPDSTAIERHNAEIEKLKQMPFDDLMSKLINDMVSFAIHLVAAILVFYIGRFIIKWLYGLVRKVMLHRHVDRSLSTFVLSMVKMLLYFILVVTVIGILGIETSSFLALFASAGVAVGMALSGTLQNFAGGVLILLLKPYRVGDYIEAQGFAGTVKEIQIFHTIILTYDNKSIIIPNGGLSTGSINNWSRESYRRVDWTVGISYGDSVEKARGVILELLASDPRVVGEGASEVTKAPSVTVDELADSSVNLKVRAWTSTADYWALYYAINERIYDELPRHGLNFPFPQLDVHLPQGATAGEH